MRFSSVGLLAVMVLTGAAAPPVSSLAPRNMQMVAPGLAQYTDKTLFGDVWKQSTLSPRDRSLVTISALIALGRTAQLGPHLKRGLDNGLSPSVIGGIVKQLAFYTGWPNAVSAIDVIASVYRDRGIDTDKIASEPVALNAPAANDGARRVEVDAGIGTIDPDLGQLTTDVLFGDLWRRTDLSPRDRSLATIAALAAGGDDAQLGFYIRLGLTNGLTRDEILATMTHLAFYAGWPKILSALPAVQTALLPADGDKGMPVRAALPVRLQIIQPSDKSLVGSTKYFTGKVTIASPFQATGVEAMSGATVTFAPGARTFWHEHPYGQWLIVTAGKGWVQDEGGPVRLIQAGDVVWIAPNTKHWHGATRTTAMTHVAIVEAQSGITVHWLGPVTDEQYHGP